MASFREIGLQLLGDVVRKERPDLETAKDKLVVSMANDKKQLADLQDKVRQSLSIKNE
jgi:dynein heavy chain, axonemal